MEIDIDFYRGTASFFVDIIAAADKSTYKGTFKVKCVLSPLEYIQSDAKYRELLGKTNPQFASEYVSQLAYALAQLRYRIIESPAWYKNEINGLDGSNVDDKILLHIFDRAVQSEEEYREGIEKRFETAKQDVKKAVDDGTLTDGKKKEEKEETEKE